MNLPGGKRARGDNTPLPYQRVQEVVSRQLFRDRDAYKPGPVVRGHPLLTTLSIAELRNEADREEPFSAMVRLISAKPLSLSREFVEGDPLASVRRFFDHLGDMWGEFLRPDGNRALKEPAGMVLAISRALWASAVAANIPAHHPAYATLLAMSLGVELQVSSSPKKLAADKVRSFAVSFVEQGQEKISTRSGKRLTKDQVREMVLSPLTTHCGWLLPRGGITSVDGLRDWERGHDVEKVERMDLHLPAFSEAAFQNHVNDTLMTLSQVLSPHFDGHLRP